MRVLLKRKSSCTVGGNVTSIAPTENNMKAAQKIKNGTIIQSSNSTSGYLFKENENSNSKR